MKLTYYEAEHLLRQQLSVPDTIRIDIETRPNLTPNETVFPAGKNYVEAIILVTEVKFPIVHKTNQKIAAIKALRIAVPGLGLVQAKSAIENPMAAMIHFAKTGEFFNHL